MATVHRFASENDALKQDHRRSICARESNANQKVGGRFPPPVGREGGKIYVVRHVGNMPILGPKVDSRGKPRAKRLSVERSPCLD